MVGLRPTTPDLFLFSPCGRLRFLGGLPRGALHDGDPGRAPDPRRPGRDHRHGGRVVPDAARGFDAHVRPDHLPHEADVRDGRPAFAEAGGGFDVVCARVFGRLAGQAFFGVGELTCLHDDFERPSRRRRTHGLDVAEDDGDDAGLQRSDVDDHVQLVGAVRDRVARLDSLDDRSRGPEREPDDGADADVRLSRGGYQLLANLT